MKGSTAAVPLWPGIAHVASHSICFVKTSYFTQSAKIKRSNPTQGLSSHSLHSTSAVFVMCFFFFFVHFQFSWTSAADVRIRVQNSHKCHICAAVQHRCLVNGAYLQWHCFFLQVLLHILLLYFLSWGHYLFLFLPIDRDEEISKYANRLN